nr:MAG TPA: cochlin-beta protein [Caudoviricetes sp.]
MPDQGRQLEQRHERRSVLSEPQQPSLQRQLEHRGPLRFTPTSTLCAAGHHAG